MIIINNRTKGVTLKKALLGILRCTGTSGSMLSCNGSSKVKKLNWIIGDGYAVRPINESVRELR